MKTSIARRRREQGAAIMLALWALFLLSGMVIAWALDIDSRITLSGNASRVLEAQAMACSGSEVAMHPLITPASPALNRQVDRNQSYSARITGEGGRLNVNWVAQNPKHTELLRRFLEAKGIDLNERDHMIDCLLDWVDPDNLVRLNGAEASENYRAANKAFRRLEELKKVKGWGDYTSVPGWENDFTVNSTGPIDLAWASRDVLLSLPGLTPELADRFLTLRRGLDEIDGSQDDPFKNAQEALNALGFSAAQIKQLAGLISFNAPRLRVVSVGKSGDVTREVQMVIHKIGGALQLITWKEL